MTLMIYKYINQNTINIIGIDNIKQFDWNKEKTIAIIDESFDKGRYYPIKYWY